MAFFAYVSCKRPNYSDTPQIELKSFNKYYNANSDVYSDSLVFQMKLKDGDGDIGLNESDLPREPTSQVLDQNGQAIYFDASDPSKKFNCIEWEKTTYTKIITYKNYFNIFFEIDKKVNGNYIKQDNSCSNLYAYRFERLSPENYTGPIDVNFTYNAKLNLETGFGDSPADLTMSLKANDIIRVRIRITDRKLNVSNEIVTQDFKVGIN